MADAAAEPEYLETMRRALRNALEAAGFKTGLLELDHCDGWQPNESTAWHSLTIEVRQRDPGELQRKQRELEAAPPPMRADEGAGDG